MPTHQEQEAISGIIEALQAGGPPAELCAADHCTLLAQVKSKQLRIETHNAVWQWIATTLAGALVSALVFWFSWPAQAVTRPEMENFIKSYSPYAVDRQLVTTTLQRLEAGQEEQAKQMQRLNEKLQRLEALMSREAR